MRAIIYQISSIYEWFESTVKSFGELMLWGIFQLAYWPADFANMDTKTWGLQSRHPK
jgi:hypothetical protein